MFNCCMLYNMNKSKMCLVNSYNTTSAGTIEITSMFLKELCDNLSVEEAQTEVYEWWIISDPLKYRLEQQGEIFLKGACCDFWGRCATGQSISLDGSCINAFIDLLKDIC